MGNQQLVKCTNETTYSHCTRTVLLSIYVYKVGCLLVGKLRKNIKTEIRIILKIMPQEIVSHRLTAVIMETQHPCDAI